MVLVRWFYFPKELQLIVLDFWPADLQQDQAMITACVNDDSGMLEKLLESPRDPNVTDEEGETPLHHAAKSGHVKPGELLLEAGGEKDAESRGGMTPLHLAARHGQLETVRFLIQVPG
eukprot:Skav223466  [mRNA]  locus=scaffold2238:96705:97058:+ [translate_table: standard]